MEGGVNGRVIGCVLIYALVSASSAAGQSVKSDSLMWAYAKSCADIRNYIDLYPSGRHIEAAQEQLRARNCVAPNRQSPPPLHSRPQPTPQPSPQPQGDQCAQARADWPVAERSTSLPVVRAYRDSLPSACSLWRVRAEERIATLENAEAQRRSADLAKSRDVARQNAIIAAYEQHSSALLPALEALSPYAQFRQNCRDAYGLFDANIYKSGSGFGVRAGEGLRSHVSGAVYILSVSGSLVETIPSTEVRRYISWDTRFAVPADVPRGERMIWDFRQHELRYRFSATSTGAWITKRRC